ncbi:MAG: hypothetical protein R2883_02855 [Caldisericia bacterium]
MKHLREKTTVGSMFTTMKTSISIGVLTNNEMISDIEFWGGHRDRKNTVEIKGKSFKLTHLQIELG